MTAAPMSDGEQVLAIIDGWMEGYDHWGTGTSKSARISQREWAQDRAELERLLRAKDAWNSDLKAAPRDGTKVDLWAIWENGPHRAANATWDLEHSEWDMDGFRASQYVTPPKITHWRPIIGPEGAK